MLNRKSAPGFARVASASTVIATLAVAEAVADGTVVGKLNAADPDGNDGFTYLVLDDAGGRFAVSGGKLVVADGLSLDFEQNASYSVQVQVTDGA